MSVEELDWWQCVRGVLVCFPLSPDVASVPVNPTFIAGLAAITLFPHCLISHGVAVLGEADLPRLPLFSLVRRFYEVLLQTGGEEKQLFLG